MRERCAGEVHIHQLFVQADRLKYLGSPIALQRRDAHLRKDFQQSLIDRFDVVLDCDFWLIVAGISPLLARSSIVSMARYGLIALAP